MRVVCVAGDGMRRLGGSLWSLTGHQDQVPGMRWRGRELSFWSRWQAWLTGSRRPAFEVLHAMRQPPQQGLLQGCPLAPSISKLVMFDPVVAVSQLPGVQHCDLWLGDCSLDVTHADPEPRPLRPIAF